MLLLQQEFLEKWTAQLAAVSAQLAAVSAQLADAVYAEVRGEQERARSMAISAAISTEVADAVHAEVRGQQERAREHERQLRSAALSAAVEEER